MRNLVKFSYFKSISIYFVFNIASAILPVVTLPIFTSYMTPSDYGVLAVFNIACMFGSSLFRLELNISLKRTYAVNINDFPKHLGTAFIFSNFALSFSLVLFILLYRYLYEYNGFTYLWYTIVILLSYMRFQSVILHNLLQLTNRPLLYSLWGLIVNIFTFGLTYVFLVSFDPGWKARVWAELLVALAAFPVSLFFLRRDFALRWEFDWGAMKEMLRFSLPLLVSSMIGYWLLVIDRLFIAKFVGAEQLGLYAVAVQLSAVVGLFFGPILPVWEAWIYRLPVDLGQKELSRIQQRLAAMIAMAIGFYVVFPPLLLVILPYLVDRSFVGVDVYLRPVIMTTLVASLLGLMAPILTFMRKVAFIAQINVMMFLLSVPTLYFAVSRWGALGAAYGLAAIYCAGLASMILYINGTARRGAK